MHFQICALSYRPQGTHRKSFAMEWEWEWVGMGIGMIRWKWEGNGNKTAIPAHLYTKIAC